MGYALCCVWYERRRFLPAVVAVGFCALLTAVQGGLLLGMLALVSLPIDQSRADVWIGYPGAPSPDLGLPIPEAWRSRIESCPEVVRTETFLMGYAPWGRPGASVEHCTVMGCELSEDALGTPAALGPELRRRLAEPGTVAVGAIDRPFLGMREGQFGEVNGHRVQVVGFVPGAGGVISTYLFCSQATARQLLAPGGLRPEQTSFILAQCRSAGDAARLVERLESEASFSAHTRAGFSFRARFHWLTRSRFGLSLSFATLLGVVVGAVVTSQTLAAAVAASAREFAVLAALGLPERRLVGLVLAQAVLVGVAGLVVAAPPTIGLVAAARWTGNAVTLPAWHLTGTASLTLSIALLSGVISLRTLRLAEPTDLLR